MKRSYFTDAAMQRMWTNLCENPRASGDELYEDLRANKWFGGKAMSLTRVRQTATGIRQRLGVQAPRRKRLGVQAPRRKRLGVQAPRRKRRHAGTVITKAISLPSESQWSATVEMPKPAPVETPDHLHFCPNCGFDLKTLKEIMRVAGTMPVKKG